MNTIILCNCTPYHVRNLSTTPKKTLLYLPQSPIECDSISSMHALIRMNVTHILDVSGSKSLSVQLTATQEKPRIFIVTNCDTWNHVKLWSPYALKLVMQLLQFCWWEPNGTSIYCRLSLIKRMINLLPKSQVLSLYTKESKPTFATRDALNVLKL